MAERLKRKYYTQPATVLAEDLVGKLLCRRTHSGIVRNRITETECYFGEEDTACHASKGKTERTKILYEKGGLAYVYLCYGMHSLFNVVTGKEGHPEAVLIRGVTDYNGPGKLTRAMGIDRELNGEDLVVSRHLWIEDDGFKPMVRADKRVGIDYATPKYRDILWRYMIDDGKYCPAKHIV